MNSTWQTILYAVAPLLVLGACDASDETRSELDFHQSIAAAFKGAPFSSPQLDEICGDSITVFIGNAEQMGFNVDWAEGLSDEQKAKQIKEEAEDAHKLYQSIMKAESDLVATLSQNPCEQRPSRNGFVSVSDAHELGKDNAGNSKIKAASWEWSGGDLSVNSITPRTYIPDGQGGVKDGDARFELNMSKDAIASTKAVLSKLFTGYKDPQMTFIFKMHGTTVEIPSVALDEPAAAFNGLMFDGYTSTNTTSEVALTPYFDGGWTFADIDVQCKDFRTREIADNLKVFCEYWANDDKSDALSSNRARTKQGRVDTGRVDTGRVDTGRVDTGRAVMKLAKPTELSADFKLEKPQMAFQSAAFATYNKDQVNQDAGIYPFQWPVPHYSKSVPVYTLFDSCQQSAQAYEAIGQAVNAVSHDKKGPFIPVIGRSSLDSVKFEELDYKALNSFQIKALPYVMYWAGTPGHPLATPEVKELAKKIDEAFRANALKKAGEEKVEGAIEAIFNKFSICTEQGNCNTF